MKTRAAFLFASMGVALAAACGGSTSNNGSSPDGGGNGGSSGASSSGSSGASSSSSGASGSSGSSSGALTDGGMCPQTPCPGSQVCCLSRGGGTCADSCPDGSLSLACTSKADCMTGEVCCVGIAAGSSCAATCSAGTYETCMTDTDCPQGESCVGMTYKVCFTIPDGGFRRPDGGGNDAGGTTDGSNLGDSASAEGSTSDAPAE